MDIQKQCCTAQQAERLRELGVAQNSYFCYAHDVKKMHPSFNGETTEWEAEYNETPAFMEVGSASFDGLVYYCAFTVAELGEAIKLHGLYTSINTVFHGWAVHHVNGYTDFDFPRGDSNSRETEAEARADILIHLLENKLISAEEVNQRLLA